MYYGWKIVRASFVTLFISVGFLFYAFGVFFRSLDEEFGGGRFAIAIGLAVMNVAMGLTAPFLGRAIDTWSIKKIMLIGASLMSVGFLAASQITALWQFYVLLGTFLGVGASMIGQLPSSTLVSNWFVRRRGMALGVATMGVSMSGVVMAPTTTYLIAEYGWRSTFMIFGVVTAAIVMPVVGLTVINRPEDIGLHPDNDPTGEFIEPNFAGTAGRSVGGPVIASSDISFASLARNRGFWGITLTISLCFFSMGSILTHMIAHATDLGITPMRASFVITFCAGIGVLGKVVFGYIADHVDTRIALFTSMALQASGTLVLLFAETYSALVVVGALFGLGMGGIVPLWGSLIGEYFGRQSFGRVMGMMTPCMLPIQVCGPPFAGLVYDRTGHYTIAFQTFLCFYAIATITLFTLLRRTEQEEVVSLPTGEEETVN